MSAEIKNQNSGEEGKGRRGVPGSKSEGHSTLSADPADHHEVRVYYDGEQVAIASGPTPCAELMGNLLTEMFRKGLAAGKGE